jgi:arylsulfatase
MAYSFDSAAAPSHRRTQYFELLGNRAIYNDGWVAASRASIPWASVRAAQDIDTLRWELYHVAEDFSEANDLAQQQPEKVRALESLWWAEAAKYQVLPLDTRAVERLNAELQGRPSLAAGRTSFTYYPGMLGLPAGTAPNLLDKSFTVSADVTIPRGAVNGVIWVMGGSDGGYGLYIRNGKPAAANNFLGRRIYRVEGPRALTPGNHKLRLEFVYDGGGMAKGGVLALYVDDQKAGEVRVVQTLPIGLGLGGTLDIGEDTGSPVDELYRPPFRFNGTINRVDLTLKPGR